MTYLEILKNTIQDKNKLQELQDKHRLGHGSFSVVYALPDHPNLVLKKSSTDYDRINDNYEHCFSDGWIVYALQLMTMKDAPAWMPKIYAMYFDRDKGHYFALMEKLQNACGRPKPWVSGYVEEDKDYFFDQIDSNRLINTFSVDPEIIWSLSKDACAIVATIDEDGIKDNRGIFFDAHTDNWMWRGDQLVMSDPYVLRSFYGMGVEKLSRINDKIFDLIDAIQHPEIEVVTI